METYNAAVRAVEAYHHEQVAVSFDHLRAKINYIYAFTTFDRHLVVSTNMQNIFSALSNGTRPQPMGPPPQHPGALAPMQTMKEFLVHNALTSVSTLPN